MYDLDISFHTLYFIGQMEYNNIPIAVFTNYMIKKASHVTYQHKNISY